MSRFYSRSATFLKGTLAKGGDVKTEFDSVSSGFDLIEDELDDHSSLEQAVIDAEAARDLAEKWAEEVEDTEVATGKFSSLHHAAKAAASAIAAATFDPASYYLRTWIDANIYTIDETSALLANKASLIDLNWIGVAANYQSSVRENLICIAVATPYTVTLPAGSIGGGEGIRIMSPDIDAMALTVSPGSASIEGGTAGENMDIDISYKDFVFVWGGSTWRVAG